jgi:hypothetical protein
MKHLAFAGIAALIAAAITGSLHFYGVTIFKVSSQQSLGIPAY